MDPVSPILYSTERLYAREIVREDADGVFEYAGDIENSGYMSWSPLSYERALLFIEQCLASQIESPRRRYRLALCRKEDDAFIGTVTLTLDDELRQGSVGYILIKSHWHCGYASEAVRGLLTFAFLGLDLHRITAACDDKNSASVRVMESVGMRREAHQIKSVYGTVFGKKGWRSLYQYAMLQKEFLCGLADGYYSPDGSDQNRN